MSIIGLLIDPIPNSLNLQNENHLADSKENCWWDLGILRVNSQNCFGKLRGNGEKLHWTWMGKIQFRRWKWIPKFR